MRVSFTHNRAQTLLQVYIFPRFEFVRECTVVASRQRPNKTYAFFVASEVAQACALGFDLWPLPYSLQQKKAEVF
eukprot:686608-Amphidinium_carterae.1